MTFRSMCAGAILAAAGTLTTVNAVAAPVFALTGDSALVGQPLFVTARAQDFVDLYGYQFSLVFDPSRVRYGSVAEGGFLTAAGSTFFDGGTVDPAAGRVDFVFDTLIGPGAGVTGSGDLATFRFTTLQAGPTAFSLDDVLAVDSRLATIAVGTAALVLAVPEPAVGAMLAAGLLAALAAMHRRRPRAARRRVA